jgi:hypothetical protein
MMTRTGIFCLSGLLALCPVGAALSEDDGLRDCLSANRKIVSEHMDEKQQAAAHSRYLSGVDHCLLDHLPISAGPLLPEEDYQTLDERFGDFESLRSTPYRRTLPRYESTVLESERGFQTRRQQYNSTLRHPRMHRRVGHRGVSRPRGLARPGQR